MNETKTLCSRVFAGPIRGQYPGHVITLGQSEASILYCLLDDDGWEEKKLSDVRKSGAGGKKNT